MNAIIDAAINRSRTVISALLLILVAGAYAYIDIAKESDPDINIPIIYVSMTHEGISPEDGERLLIRPMELELRSIEGVKEMTASASEGHASVTLEFDAGFDVDKALQDVREKVDLAKTELPQETDDPTVNEVNFALFPVIVVTLSGDVPLRTLIKLAKELEDRVEGLPGVLEADIGGDREEVLEVIIDPVKLESYKISNAELANAVVSNNKLIAAGSMDTGKGRFAIKVPGLYKNASDVLDIPVKVNNEGVVTLRDVTEVRRTFKDADSYARLNGRPAVALEIKKRVGENIIETIEAVKLAVAEEQSYWPENVVVTFSQDRSEDIRNMLLDLQNNIISAIILVMIVVISALGVRTAGLVGLSIPGSFLIGILYMYLIGLTINIVVLFGLILAVGMLVDGAIVVTEFADRKMAEGVHRRQAYALAAKRMAWPIIASTATTLAVFMPLMFWPGVVGEFMKYLPLTLITTLTGSLLMALIFVPTLGSVFGRAGSTNSKSLAALAAAESGDILSLGGLTGRYVRFLAVCIKHPAKIVVLGLVTLVGVQIYYATHGNGVEFFPEVEPEMALVYVHARGNMSTDEKDLLVGQVEQEILKLDDFEGLYTRSGTTGGGQNVSEDVIGIIQIEFKDWQERRPVEEIFTDIRERTAHLTGIVVEARKPDNGPPTGKHVQIQLSSRNPDLLPIEIEKIRHHLETNVSDLIDLEDSRPIPGIEWQVTVDRSQAGRFGADIQTVGKTIQLVTNGIKADEYRPNDADDEIDIRLRFPDDKRSIDQLDNLRVMTTNGMVPISNFVTREARQKVGTISRSDSRRIMTVKANVAAGVLVDDKVQEIQAWIQNEANINPEVSYVFKGQDEEQKKAGEFLGKAFAVALFIMAIILVTQFNSFYHAFLILTAVIMSTIGVFVGLIITGQPFGIVMTGVGVIALAGIVVNNNIVLIDTYAHLRKQGMEAMEAVLRTGAQRLRPVMLTTVTTIFGLLPMTLQINIDFVSREVVTGAPSSQWWVQLSTAVAFGLTFATLLTLIMTPSLLMLGANVSSFLERHRENKAAKKALKNAHPEPAE
ncbi:efflux RND transporter permease subunit [Sneathiella sp. HT1-7]|jgi:multidrug efflux pump|uniref:efflux RND transporter permease subunit n=1 Tax=Sneathiella sp. HT1-7 TaxID=2887192 RepID=UPI001D1492EC|nr:efflux RND transporter permease subunit [Sneathiella sp. HT1-7]MCC3306258.1 efflux RND transporter permease subunit [Sneathiella sp. HT1-7]